MGGHVVNGAHCSDRGVWLLQLLINRRMRADVELMFPDLGSTPCPPFEKRLSRSFQHGAIQTLNASYFD
jgi:hypothetical protein